MEVYAPRSFVLSLDDGNENQNGGNTGTKAPDVLGATFTISQIPDFVAGVLNALPGPPAATNGNQLTFEFSEQTNTLILPNGNINVSLIASGVLDNGYRVPDIMLAISRTIAGLQILADQVDIPMLGNHENGNGPDGRSGPITRGRAFALGGQEGDNLGVRNLSLRPEGFDNTSNFFFGTPIHYNGPIDSDFPFGFGHDRTENGNVSVIPANTLTDGIATTELYVLFENIANIELSPEAIAAGFKLTPDAAKPEYADNADQLITEHGIWVTGGSSPTLLNNVLSNLHQSVVIEESTFTGFGKRVEVFGDQFVKPQEVVLVGSVFQYDEERNSEIRFDLTWPVDFEQPFDVFDTSLSTDNVVGATNVADQSDDFNFVVDSLDPSLFVDAAGNNFLPADGSILIDSAINAVDDRDEFVTLKSAIGLPASNVLAPARDVIGVLRVDNEFFATPGAIGFSVFKDRGSNELADFIGPVATSEIPRDNDAGGIDTDPSTSFLNLASGTYDEFRIQLRDTGDESDPFAGFGVDDRTVVVSEIPGLRPTGANVTLFEDGRLLEEGIDYSFNYDETKNIITLTPLAGIWENTRAYRIQLNNQDRTVLVAPDPNLINDGDQVSITDSNGGTLVFEFEAGYSLLVPEPITLVVPEVGTNAAVLNDGDIFQINDNVNPIVVFEFNSDNATLPGSVSIPLPAQTPAAPSDLPAFLNGIASNIADAIQAEVDAGRLDVDVKLVDNLDGSSITSPQIIGVVVGAEPGTTATTTGSGLQQLSRTLGLRVPDAGVGLGGIVDGDTFVVDNGTDSVIFELDTNNVAAVASNVLVPVAGLNAPEIAAAIRDAVASANLGLNPSVSANGTSVYLNLPLNGTASVGQGQLALVGLSRTPTDGDTLEIMPVNPVDADVILEINRTDIIDPITGMPSTVLASNVPVNVTRLTTGSEFASLVSNAIQSQLPIDGISQNDLRVINGGLLSIGGEEDLGLAVTGTSLEVTGSPAVTGASTIQVFGPLLLNLPLVGGGGVRDGSVIVLTDDTGADVIFEFDRNQSTPSAIPGAIPIAYDSFSTVDVIAANLVAAINAANIGINAQDLGIGSVSLGRIDAARVNITGIVDPLDPLVLISGIAPEATLRRGIVSDGEVLSIRQGTTTVTFEFEAAVGGGGVAANNVAVPFQPGSTVGDIAISLAAAINNNKGNLVIGAVAETVGGNPTGQVLLDDQAGTVIDVVRAPTLNVTGVPGGATPIRVTPAFTATQVKFALIDAINRVNVPGEPAVTTLSAEDRGGSTFFVANGQIFRGPVSNYSLPAIADLAGNPLEANRDDLSTQFTILMPTVGLDFGDAPDPVRDVPGRYPTTNASDGPRHVVDDRLFLGQFVDADFDGSPGTEANGDDLLLEIFAEGALFTTSLAGGEGTIAIQTGSVNALDRDGDTITIDTGVAKATLEFDVNGRFDEDNFAIRPDNPSSSVSIAAAIIRAIEESPVDPASVTFTSATVTVNADDEDGVIFTSDINPTGVLNRGLATPIDVSVTGGGVLEAWIDFNADGDWDDPGEQIIPTTNNALFNERLGGLCDQDADASNLFAETGSVETRTYCIVVPPTTPVPPAPIDTYARFRVSREGGLSPSGLALSGEVEDYVLTLLPGDPPVINQANISFVVEEDQPLQALDLNGVLTPTTANDDGLLAGVSDAQNDVIRIFSDDVGGRTLTAADGTIAGQLDLAADGTFVFIPAVDFNGVTGFSARVTDVQLNQETELVSSQPISVTINVVPVNDRPEAVSPPVSITRTINEDESQTFFAVDANDPTGAQDLIGSKFVSGPATEADQPLFIQSAGSSRGNALSTLGGNVSISDDGLSIVYTPPVDYNGPDADTFSYIVADIPGVGQISEEAEQRGTVTINFLPVNDAPRTTNDNYDAQEGVTLSIPIRGSGTIPGILDNDFSGPPDEVTADPTVNLVAGQFPITTDQGGTVHMINSNALEYTPADLFSGVDVFRYTVVDAFGAESTGTVSINVGGVNNSPTFIGINGDINVLSITRDETKVQDEIIAFDLNTWFNDPEDDDLTFTVTSSNSAVVLPEVNGGTLSLTFPRFGFGESLLTVTASDGSTAPTSQPINVTVNDTPDPPSVIGTLNPLSGTEDQVVTANLAAVFNDPDAGSLDYLVARIGNVINPTTEQIAQHPLVDSIGFVGDQLRIQLKPNQSGAVDIEIAATDGSFRVSDTFTLNVSPVPDNPISTSDRYNVPVGSTLQILNPSDGLLRNDTDPDGDALTVDLSSVTQPALGTVQVNSNGTFVYTSQDGSVGQTDSFRYRVIDVTGRPSGTVEVELMLNQSRYQNPLADLNEDVNADGQISAIDALRVINFLNRELINDTSISVPVSQIGAPPPDYYDANGDGRVSASDALMVINQLRRVQLGEGELVGMSTDADASAVTSSFVAPQTSGLPVRNVEQVRDENTGVGEIVPHDLLLTSGFDISPVAAEHAVQAVSSGGAAVSSSDSVDEALSLMLDEFTLDGELD
ncbi:MAG: Ig-like domain-containing protein [Rubripirellula sp.]